MAQGAVREEERLRWHGGKVSEEERLRWRREECSGEPTVVQGAVSKEERLRRERAELPREGADLRDGLGLVHRCVVRRARVEGAVGGEEEGGEHFLRNARSSCGCCHSGRCTRARWHPGSNIGFFAHCAA